VQDSFASGGRSSFAATGGFSTMGTIGGGDAANDASFAAAASSSSESTQPAWAQRLRRGQTLSHGASSAAHAVRSGDSHGGGHSVNLSQEE
jgi:type IV secretion system protein TrbL